MEAAALAPASGTITGRIPTHAPSPSVPGGLFRPKAFAGEVVPFRVTAFREGHDRIGVHVRERIDIDDLLLPVTPGRKAPRPANEVQMRVCERRKPSVEERAATSARFARAFDFAALAIVALGLAVLASGMAVQAFGSPMAQVETALKGTR